MCGRYTLRTAGAKLAEAFGVEESPSLFEPRFNAAPTQTMPVVRLKENGSGRELSLMRWGLVPSWADDKSIGSGLINARADGVATKPAFRSAFRRRRCLVPVDGFYEWEKIGRKKQPFFITMTDGRPFAFAGLWEKWDKNDESLESFTILTTEANELLQPLHDRMPVILAPKDYDAWLDSQRNDPAELSQLLKTYTGDDLKTFPVNPVVNSPKYDGPLCVEEQTGGQGKLF
jgi:putative SOS response-associated peptidase YedK